eukprot:2255900-Amphidinium_carterae.1
MGNMQHTKLCYACANCHERSCYSQTEATHEQAPAYCLINLMNSPRNTCKKQEVKERTVQLLLTMEGVPGQLGQHRAKIAVSPAAEVPSVPRPVPTVPSGAELL